MNNYVVAIVDFFENQVKQYKIVASDKYEAIKKGMVEHCSSEEAKQHELDYQNSEDYPKTYEEIEHSYEEMSFDVTQVKEF